MRVSEVAGLLEVGFEGDAEAHIYTVAALVDAGPQDLSFAYGKAVKDAGSSRAGCLLVPENFSNTASRNIIRVRDPRAAVAKIIAVLHPPQRPEQGVHPTAVLGRDVVLGEGCSVAPFVSIGQGVQHLFRYNASSGRSAGSIDCAGPRSGHPGDRSRSVTPERHAAPCGQQRAPSTGVGLGTAAHH